MSEVRYIPAWRHSGGEWELSNEDAQETLGMAELVCDTWKALGGCWRGAEFAVFEAARAEHATKPQKLIVPFYVRTDLVSHARTKVPTHEVLDKAVREGASKRLVQARMRKAETVTSGAGYFATSSASSA